MISFNTYCLPSPPVKTTRNGFLMSLLVGPKVHAIMSLCHQLKVPSVERYGTRATAITAGKPRSIRRLNCMWAHFDPWRRFYSTGWTTSTVLWERHEFRTACVSQPNYKSVRPKRRRCDCFSQVHYTSENKSTGPERHSTLLCQRNWGLYSLSQNQ